MATELPTAEDLVAARTRVSKLAHRTPLLRSSQADARAGAELWFKCENLQRVGAFKFRGACNAVFGREPAAVATHSSGNHGQALALAAKLRGIPCHVVMPRDAPAAKRAAVAGYGATIVDCEPTLAARESTLDEVVAQTGAEFVHPYNDPWVVAGQATAAMEVLDDVVVDAIAVPVGGGGLMAGTCLAARNHEGRGSAPIEVHGIEPKLADDAEESLRTGQRIGPRPPITIADGLRTALGDIGFEVGRRHLTQMHLVEEDQIVEAMRFVWERMNVVIEPSAAVPLAAAFAGAFTGKRVAIVFTGGNVDLGHLPWQGPHPSAEPR